MEKLSCVFLGRAGKSAMLNALTTGTLFQQNDSVHVGGDDIQFIDIPGAIEPNGGNEQVHKLLQTGSMIFFVVNHDILETDKKCLRNLKKICSHYSVIFNKVKPKGIHHLLCSVPNIPVESEPASLHELGTTSVFYNYFEEGLDKVFILDPTLIQFINSAKQVGVKSEVNLPCSLMDLRSNLLEMENLIAFAEVVVGKLSFNKELDLFGRISQLRVSHLELLQVYSDANNSGFSFRIQEVQRPLTEAYEHFRLKYYPELLPLSNSPNFDVRANTKQLLEKSISRINIKTLTLGTEMSRTYSVVFICTEIDESAKQIRAKVEKLSTPVAVDTANYFIQAMDRIKLLLTMSYHYIAT